MNPQKLHELSLVLNNSVNQRIIEYLNEKGEANVTTLQNDFRMAQCAISNKLGQLKEFGITKSYKTGRKVYYSIDKEKVDQINDILLLINKLNQKN